MNASFVKMLKHINSSNCLDVPPIRDTIAFTDDLVHLLFPIMENHQMELSEVQQQFESMQVRLNVLMQPLKIDNESPVEKIVQDIFEEIPHMYQILVEDANIFLASDPAACCLEEVVICYPGFYALTIHRLAHSLYTRGIPLLPRVMSEYAHGKTGIDIHPGAQIGRRCYIDHGTGIVIGETAVVGDNVKIYQGVTLGATFVEKRLKHTKRHPTIEDNVILYAGSTILGKSTVIGHDTIIGGNVWLTESVAPNSVVYRQQESVIRDKGNESTPINWVI